LQKMIVRWKRQSKALFICINGL